MPSWVRAAARAERAQGCVVCDLISLAVQPGGGEWGASERRLCACPPHGKQAGVSVHAGARTAPERGGTPLPSAVATPARASGRSLTETETETEAETETETEAETETETETESEAGGETKTKTEAEPSCRS